MEEIILVADVIIQFENDEILLAKRKYEPFKTVWGLPGGKHNKNETIEQTALREVKEETGLVIELISLLDIFSNPDRDPRGRYISFLFTAQPIGGNLKAGSDAEELMKIKNIGNLALAFDHNEMIKKFREKINR